MRPIDYAGANNLPKLFIAGANDEHTKLEESNELFTAAGEQKELWVVPDAKHVDFYPLVKEEYEQRVLLFFEKHLREKNAF